MVDTPYVVGYLPACLTFPSTADSPHSPPLAGEHGLSPLVVRGVRPAERPETL